MISKNLRNSAKGQQCTLRIVDVCNGNPETTVLAHLPDESKGMSKKADDISSCYACSACHDVLDGRVWAKEWECFCQSGLTVCACGANERREWYMRRAMTRTLKKAVADGVVRV